MMVSLAILLKPTLISAGGRHRLSSQGKGRDVFGSVSLRVTDGKLIRLSIRVIAQHHQIASY